MATTQNSVFLNDCWEIHVSTSSHLSSPYIVVDNLVGRCYNILVNDEGAPVYDFPEQIPAYIKEKVELIALTIHSVLNPKPTKQWN